MESDAEVMKNPNDQTEKMDWTEEETTNDQNKVYQQSSEQISNQFSLDLAKAGPSSQEVAYLVQDDEICFIEPITGKKLMTVFKLKRSAPKYQSFFKLYDEVKASLGNIVVSATDWDRVNAESANKKLLKDGIEVANFVSMI